MARSQMGRRDAAGRGQEKLLGIKRLLEHPPHVTERELEQIAAEHYATLYRFAMSLVRDQADACDLTQQTFVILAKKSHQIRDRAKLQSWLLTTLRRLFLGRRRHHARFPHLDLETAGADLPSVTPEAVERLDAQAVLEALRQVDEPYRDVLTLFYFEECSYKEIAEALNIPPGTVMSRLSRGKEQIRRALSLRTAPGTGTLPDDFHQPDGKAHA